MPYPSQSDTASPLGASGRVHIHATEAYQSLIGATEEGDVHDGGDGNTENDHNQEGYEEDEKEEGRFYCEEDEDNKDRHQGFNESHVSPADHIHPYNNTSTSSTLNTIPFSGKRQIGSSRYHRAQGPLAAAQRRREDKFQQLYGQLLHEREGILQEVTDELRRSETVRNRQRDELHASWHRDVYDVIQGRIAAAVDQRSTEEVEQRHRDMMASYLEATNASDSGVFRDIIIESYYDPLASRRYPVKYRCDDVEERDPLAMPQAGPPSANKKGTGAKKKGTGHRGTLDVRIWDRVESTPHGRYHREQDGTRTRMEDGRKGKTGDSQVVLDDYGPRVDRDTIRQEFPPTRKILSGPKDGLEVGSSLG